MISRGRGPPLAEGGTPFRSRPVVGTKMEAFIRMLLGVFGDDLSPSSQSEGGGSHTQSGRVTGPEGGTQGPGGTREVLQG